MRDSVDLFQDLLQIKMSCNYEEIDHVNNLYLCAVRQLLPTREMNCSVLTQQINFAIEKEFILTSGLFVSEAAGILHVWSYFFTKTSNEWHEASTTTALPPTIEPNNL